MRRVLTMLGVGVPAGVGLFIVGAYTMPWLTLWMVFGPLTW